MSDVALSVGATDAPTLVLAYRLGDELHELAEANAGRLELYRGAGGEL